MNETSKACLSIWHSSALKYIVMTICAIIFLSFIRKMLKEFVDCKSQCEIPKAAEGVMTKTANYLMNRAFSQELNKAKQN